MSVGDIAAQDFGVSARGLGGRLSGGVFDLALRIIDQGAHSTWPSARELARDDGTTDIHEHFGAGRIGGDRANACGVQRDARRV